GLERNRGRERVAAEGAAVIARLEHRHDLAAGEKSRYRQQSAAEGFAEDQSVGLHALVVAGEQPTGAPQPGLDFVGDEQHLVPAADVFAFGEIAARRNDDSLLALNRLNQKRG